VNLSRIDYWLARLAHAGAGLFESVGNVESTMLRRRLDAIPIEAPIFVCGLARSGTTIVLQELSQMPNVATHRYRDFPFLMTPWLWSRLVDRAGAQRPETERPHQDRIRVSAQSPEAFEEPLWQFFFPQLHAAESLHRLTGELRSAEFDAFFRDHIRKILLLRGGRRYLSKGNYNIVRLEYLAALFPDACFVIPIRHPFTHVQSLVRQHALFTAYAERDPRVSHYLRAAGHYEFGPQRLPIRLSHESGDRIRDAWHRGDDATGYAIQWAEVYRFVRALLTSNDDLAARTSVVRYEDFCDRPAEVMTSIWRHTQLDPWPTNGPRAFEHIVASPHDSLDLPDQFREAVWREAGSVAKHFGYLPEKHRPSDAGDEQKADAVSRFAAEHQLAAF
jgi:Sulfotransferase family